MGPRNVLLKRAAELTGYTERALREKIKKRVWPEGCVWFKAPDGHLMINMEEYDAWAGTDRESEQPLKPPSKSISPIRVSRGKGRAKSGSPPPLV